MYIREAFRNLARNKLITCVNIAGLVIGLTLIIHLTVYIDNEKSFDRFHAKHSRIYRILTKSTEKGKKSNIVGICQGQLPAIIDAVPEVEKCLRIYGLETVDLEYNENRLVNNHIIYADSTFFDVFSFKLIVGTPDVLKDPNSIILSRTFSIKVFGNDNALGKTVRIRDKEFTVGGILEDIPQNSHLQFTILTGFHDPFLENLVQNSGCEFYTYVLLHDKTDTRQALGKISKMYASFMSGFRSSGDENTHYEGVAQPLDRIRLHSEEVVWDVQHGSLYNIWLASGLIGFIMIIAILNFINLVTVSAETRLREVGIRKLTGAIRKDLIMLFINETIMIALISLALSLACSVYTWHFVNDFTVKNIPLKELFNPTILLFIISITLFVGIISGIFPALHLSYISVFRILKGTVTKSGRKGTFIKGLLLSQFAIVIFMVCCVMVFYKQMDFIKHKNLGFDKENVIAVKSLDKSVYAKYETIRQKLLKYSGIEDVCLAQDISVSNMSGQYAGRPGENPDNFILVNHTRTTAGFVKTFRLNIIEGRDFNDTLATDRKNFIINETAAKALGFTDSPIDKPLIMNDSGRIIGVVRDFNFASLHNTIDPLIITLNDLKRGTLFVRVKSFHIQDGLDNINQTIKSVDPLYNLDYEFVDDRFNIMYTQEVKMSQLLYITTFIAIFLSFMGLVALTTFVILRRVKEIGIRKINGASVVEIIILLNHDYTRRIILAFVFACPVSYLVMQKWLANFAYKTAINWWIFISAGVFIFVASLATVSIICWKTANRNPVEALRFE
ncbi:MAG TPA: ABC transporter permease [Bacteroidales bacterium]|nr:ABC transporter permease [Bacteroidales bacterium]